MVNICNAAATWAVNANSALFGSVGNAFKKFSDGPCNPIFTLFASEATYVELKLTYYSYAHVRSYGEDVRED